MLMVLSDLLHIIGTNVLMWVPTIHVPTREGFELKGSTDFITEQKDKSEVFLMILLQAALDMELKDSTF